MAFDRRKLKPPMEYMIESIEEHTIELEKILLTVKEISDRLDILIEEKDEKSFLLWSL